MRWRLFTLISALSLIVLVGTLWLWSYRDRPGGNNIEITCWKTYVRLRSASYGLELDVVRNWPGPAEFRAGPVRKLREVDWYTVGPDPGFKISDAFGVKTLNGTASTHVDMSGAPVRLPNGKAISDTVGGLPYWSIYEVPHRWVAGAAVLLPIVWLVMALQRMASRRRTRRLGLCPACGYDLRASPDRCPECGAVPARTASAGSTGEGEAA